MKFDLDYCVALTPFTEMEAAQVGGQRELVLLTYEGRAWSSAGRSDQRPPSEA